METKENKLIFKMSYNVDLVLCMDATNSMRPLLDMVKDNALNLYDDLMRKANSMEPRMPIDSFRIRLIAFRDYRDNGEEAMCATDFMTMPGQKQEFKTVVDGISPKGGGDIPEDALEALAFAIRSEWKKADRMSKNRQIIVLWTDSPPHTLGYCRTLEKGGRNKDYPDNMPGSFAELTDWWGTPNSQYNYMDQRGKRLIIYGPKKETVLKNMNQAEIDSSMDWCKIEKAMNHTVLVESIAGQGLREHQYETILNTIMSTIAD